MLAVESGRGRMDVATAAGLSTAEAAARRAAQGPNRLPEPRRQSVARRLAQELTHFFALMLWVAAGLALLADLPELGVAIAAVIVLNALFAFAQRTRADRAAERLRAMLPTRVTVRRDGRRRIIEAEDVVVVKMGEKFEVVATNTMPDQVFIASPAIAGGEIYLRSQNRLFCVSEKTARAAR